MGAYGSPELHPNLTGGNKNNQTLKHDYSEYYSSGSKGKIEFDVIRCPKCGEPIKISRKIEQPVYRRRITPGAILKYSVCIALSIIVLMIALVVVRSFFVAL